MHAWEQIQLTLDYIEEHLDEKLEIENLAKIAALSPFYYQRLFSRLVKKPVVEYIKLRRMAKATEVLLQKDRRILDIALELGFSSHEHFTRTFKDTFDMTPEEYRNSPKSLNRMTKPQLLLKYTLVDEDTPLIADDIILEITRRQIAEPEFYIGLEKKMPVQFVEGLGIESGVDPLETLWNTFHEQKSTICVLTVGGDELGVSYPSSEEGYFNYFAGAKAECTLAPDGYKIWELPQGDYIVCYFEAENFEALIMDALYKAQQYIYNIWLSNHQLRTESFCVEHYASHNPETTSMEIWLKLLK